MPLTLVVCLAALSLTGCAERLTDRTAASVLDDWLQTRRQSGMPELTEGMITIQIGTVRGLSDNNRCELPNLQPHELPELQRYASAGIIHLERPESCKWEVTLSQQAEQDLFHEGRLRPPTTLDNTPVSIILGRWDHFDIHEISQDGTRSKVDSVNSFVYTGTMKQLARAGVFPRLDSGCTYDQRTYRIQCENNVTMTFQDGKWQMDTTVADTR